MQLTAEQTFIMGLRELARVCKFDLSDWSLEAYTGVFAPHGYELGVKALKEAFRNTSGRMPSPYELLEQVGLKRPEAPGTRDEANEVSSAIIAAIAKYGGYRAVEAKAHLGEHAWAVVEGFGGWENLCMMNLDEVPILKAQMRDAAESKTKIAHHRPEAIGTGELLTMIESCGTRLDDANRRD